MRSLSLTFVFFMMAAPLTAMAQEGLTPQQQKLLELSNEAMKRMNLNPDPVPNVQSQNWEEQDAEFRKCLGTYIGLDINGQQLRMGPIEKLMVSRRRGRMVDPSELCDVTKMGTVTLPVYYAVFFHNDPSSPGYRPQSLCGGKISGWKKDICNDRGNINDGENFPEQIVLYAHGNYPWLWYEGVDNQFYDSTFTYYQEQVQKSGGEYRPASGGHPEITLFPRTPYKTEFVYISRDKDLRAPDGSPYAVSCVTPPTSLDKLNYSEMANCWASYAVNDDISVKYKFSSIVDKIPTRLKVMDGHVRDMIKDWLSAHTPAKK